MAKIIWGSPVADAPPRRDLSWICSDFDSVPSPSLKLESLQKRNLGEFYYRFASVEYLLTLTTATAAGCRRVKAGAHAAGLTNGMH